MLRASVEHHQGNLDPRAVTAGCGPCGVDGADEILALTDAVVLRDNAEYPDARVRAELLLGRHGADRIAMVAANFQMMNRLLDAIGAPVPARLFPLAEEMNLTVPDHLREDRR
ncbi:MAG: hypothetical protein AAGC53_11035 [Actinomycetota bacterium]